jgi:hypothetical protein
VPPWVPYVDEGPDDRPLLDQLLALFRMLDAYFVEVVPRITALRGCNVNISDAFRDVPPERCGPIRGLTAVTGWLRRARERGLVGDVDLAAAAQMIIGSAQMGAFIAHVVKHEPAAPSRTSHLRALAQLACSALAPPRKEPRKPSGKRGEVKP